MPKKFGDMTLPMPAHDNARGGLQVPSGAAPKALSAGKSVGKRHGKSAGTATADEGCGCISKVDTGRKAP